MNYKQKHNYKLLFKLIVPVLVVLLAEHAVLLFLTNHVHDIAYKVLLNAVSILVLISLLIFYYQKYIIKRIVTITRAALATAIDSFDDETSGKLEEGQDEIGELAKSFKSLLINLRGTNLSRDEIMLEATRRLKIERELREAHAQSVFESLHDKLTRLANRDYLFGSLNEILKKAKRDNNLVGVLFIDLDNFKTINDTMGHAVGDFVLIETAKKLRSILRESDIVSRVGGDEIVVVLTEIKHDIDAGKVAKLIIETLSQPFVYEGNEIYIGASIGISIFPDDGTDSDVLVNNADEAMYHAKRNGRNRYIYYTKDINIAALKKRKMLDSLQNAIDNHEFLLYLQPQYELPTEEIRYYEALLRWQDPTGQVLVPASFLDLAEESGLIHPITNWVLHFIGKKLYANNIFADLNIKICINFAASQIIKEDFVSSIVDCFNKYGIDPRNIEIEITENVFIHDEERIIDILTELKSYGFTIALDDFGTGFSCLKNLARLPIDCLKIDKSFVIGVEEDERKQKVVNTIIAMADHLELDLVAEGVETLAQEKFLIQAGCTRMQGKYFAEPKPWADVEREILSQNNTRDFLN